MGKARTSEYCEICFHRVYSMDKHLQTVEHKRRLAKVKGESLYQGARARMRPKIEEVSND